jgi:hypothetical protein
MSKSKKVTTLIISLIVLLLSFALSVTTVFAWFGGQGFSGDSMTYSRNIYIGSTSSEVTNYHGYLDDQQNFNYTEIDPLVGFEYSNLVPGSYMYLRTDVKNTSLNNVSIVSLYLQNIVYDSPLNSFLYFGSHHPVDSLQNYASQAVLNEQASQYNLNGVSLLNNYHIQADDTLSFYWFVYIDSGAGLEVANNYINLGELTLIYN